MYSLLTYPLDVIKTNRIMATPLDREAGENLPRELVALYDRGALKSSYRGLFPFLVGAGLWGDIAKASSERTSFFHIAAGTFGVNFFYAVNTKRQVVSDSLAPISYRSIFAERGALGFAKLVTIGYTAHVGRNSLLAGAMMPRN